MDRQAAWNGGGSFASPSTMASTPPACPQFWPTSTPTGGTCFQRTLSRPRWTTSGRKPMRRSTCPAPSTLSGTRSPTQRSKLLLLYQETAHQVSFGRHLWLLPVTSPFPVGEQLPFNFHYLSNESCI
uniref:Uncharacterized protein n=1 Tax=Triticum urartu TaxID=4572 RepID=A0A8R7QV02_TRIUA